MVRFLLNRPIAVFLTFFVLIVVGIISFEKIPVSLLPNIDVPQIIVKVSYPNTSAAVIEENVIRQLRENLITLSGLEDLESQSTNHIGSLKLTFDHTTKMDLAFIEVNEKIDHITNNFPKDVPRPQVIKVNTSDIPIVRIQVIPKRTEDYLQISDLTQKVLKKRIEQIDGVSLVDINGMQTGEISIEPIESALSAVGLNDEDLAYAVKAANKQLGSLSIRDGQFRFFIKLTNRLENTFQIASIPLRLKDGTVSELGKFAKVSFEITDPQGYHLFNGKIGMVVTVHKQARSRMNELMPQINSVVNNFKEEYPAIQFNLTQDQTYLLNQGIQNLTQDLWYGGALCVILLFLFLGNMASPILMSISIPISLLLTFILFYLFNLSFNIISLSGLALGIGMLIDNSIIVLDNITRKRREGLPMEESCIVGVKEVVSPIISNVLTTVAIYLPLIYMSGLAGALIYDQAIALTISLGVSLIVAFGLNPLLYKYFLKTPPEKLKEDTAFYLYISNAYHKMVNHAFKHKWFYFTIPFIIMPLGFILLYHIPVATLPKITETETLITLDWNVPVNAIENRSRVINLGKIIENKVESWEADVGNKQFLFQEDNNNNQKAEIYYKTANSLTKDSLDKLAGNWIKNHYPNASWSINNAPNAFTQLFEDNQPYFEARFKPLTTKIESEFENNVNKAITEISNQKFEKGISFLKEMDLEMTMNNNKMALYGLSQNEMEDNLQKTFGTFNISEIKRFGDVKAVNFKTTENEIDKKLSTIIYNVKGFGYPLNAFINYNYGLENKYIVGDRSGTYKSISFMKKNIQDIKSLEKELYAIASNNNLTVDFKGKYLTDKILLKELMVIFIISLLLLYLILAIQFENLIHPLIVMLTIPLGIGGAALVLWLSGGTLDIMAAIGFVVVLGIIVDDPSLKIETINRLRDQYIAQGLTNNNEILIKALHEAGEICLKPLLMVSLTTSLALLPVYFSGGIGNDLQKPLVSVIVGGLTIGTFFTLWFIPLAYWFTARKK